MEGLISPACFGPIFAAERPENTGFGAAVSFFRDNRFIGKIALH
jgi:hypothetical protein